MCPIRKIEILRARVDMKNRRAYSRKVPPASE